MTTRFIEQEKVIIIVTFVTSVLFSYIMTTRLFEQEKVIIIGYFRHFSFFQLYHDLAQ
jgi:hypothetical protein